MKRFLLYLLVISTLLIVPLYLVLTAAWGTSESLQTMPTSGASFLSNLQTFLRTELAGRFQGAGLTNYVTSGGLHATAGSCTSAAFSLAGVTSSGNRITADGAAGTAVIDYSAASISANCANPGTDVCWVVGSSAGQSFSATNGRTVVTMPTLPGSAFNRVGTTNLYVNCTASTTTTLPLPTLPADSVYLMKTTITNGAITGVQDLRNAASWRRMGACELTDPLFGAVGDGVADDTAAIQAAADNYACKVVTGRGSEQFKVTSTLTITRHFKFMGLGAGPGGAVSPDGRFQGMAINHAFNGTLLYFPGILNDVITPLGFELENMILRQVYGNNSAPAGKAIDVLATTSNFRPTWLKVNNVNIEQDSTADSWTWGIYIDGTAVTTGGIGARDNFFSNMRVVSGANSTGSIGLYTATNARLTNILINGSNCDVTLSGVSGNTGQLSHMSGVQGTCGLTVDWATGNSCYDCGFDTVTVTANATSYNYRGSISGAPTIALGAVAVFVESAGAMYFSGDNNRYYKYKAIDGNQTRLGLDVNAGVSAYINWQDAGTEKWAMGKAANNSFFFNGAASQAIMTVSTGGLLTTKRGTAKAGSAPTYGVTVTVDASIADVFLITVTNNSNFTITTTNNTANQILTIIVLNSSGGAMGTITWDASIFRLAGAFVNPADTYQRAISFRCSGTKQQEISRNAADVSGG